MQFLVAASALLTVANAISVVSLGSSYSFGAGLNQSYGQILTNLLSSEFPTTYTNLALSGSNLSSISNVQAPRLNGTNPDVVVISAGGNDLNYVGCLITYSESFCGKTIDEAIYGDRFTCAINSILSNVANPDTVIIYIVDYPQALGADTACPSSYCELDNAQVNTLKGVYTNLINWTVDFQANYTKANPNVNLRLLPTRQYSQSHDLGSRVPWVNGNTTHGTGNGDAWHPNSAGANFLALAVYEGLLHNAAPCYQNCSIS